MSNPSLSYVERLTLFVSSMHKAHAAALLEGLVSPKRHQALQLSQHLTRWDSATRQARLAREFGAQRDALERLRGMLAHAPPLLRAAMAEHLPAPVRAAFSTPPALTPAAFSSALRGRAQRLIHEAVR